VNPKHTLSPFVAKIRLLCCGLGLAGQLSLTFGATNAIGPDNGFLPPNYARPFPPGRALLLPDGKYLLFLNFFDTLTDQATGAVVRFLPNGTVDNSFNFSREYKGVSDATPADNDKLYVAAVRYLYGTKEAEQILRLNADGSIDPTFAAATVGGADPFQDVREIIVQPDGKVIVVGLFRTFGGNDARDGIVRLLSDGTVDPSFAPVTINGTYPQVYAGALQSDGKILIGGTFSNVNGVADVGVVRLNTDGSLDTSFQATGFSRYSLGALIRAIALQSDGQILVSGKLRIGTGFPNRRTPLVRLNPSGTLDSTFDASGFFASTGTGRELVMQPDGKIVMVIESSVYRVNSNGSYDPSFHQPGFIDATLVSPFSDGTPVTINRYADGRFLVGGIFTDADPPGNPNYAHCGVVGLNSDGNVDTTFTTSHRTGIETAPSSFARLSDGSTLVAFSKKIDPPVPYNLGRLLPDGTVDSTFTLSSSDPSRFLADFSARGIEPLPDGNFLVYGVDSYDVPYYGKVRPNGVEDTTFATNQGAPFQTAMVGPDGSIVGASGTDAQLTFFLPFARLQADGQVAPFGNNAIHDAQVIRDVNGMLMEVYIGNRVLAVQPDGKVLVQYFAQDRLFHFVRLNPDGSIDGSFAETNFTPTDLSEDFPFIFDYQAGAYVQPYNGVWTASPSLIDAHVQSDGRIIVTGHFTTFGNRSARGIARLNPNGSFDDTFNVGGGAQWRASTETSTFYPAVENIEPAGDKFLITGTFEAFNGTSSPGIAQLNADGSVDSSFVAPVQRDKRSRVASAFKAQPDGSFLLSGPYIVNGESTARSLIRLVPLAPNVGNISTRLAVGTGDNALIEGFIVQGPAGSSKKILVRAIGPSLAQFGIPDALSNPILEIHDAGGATVATNNDWKTTQIGGLIAGNQFAEINASGLAPTDDLESAIVADLAPGSYTAVVRGAGDTAGTGVVDAFDLAPGSAARLANIATRGLVQPGDGLMIGGFIVQNGPLQVVVRAIGPSLVPFGIPNALPDTTLQLRDQQGALVLENDDWRSSQAQELINLGLQPSDDLEAALVSTLQPGPYTAQVRGKGQAAGIGVVQVYFIQ
jgi:uncharacterized delta-60 repeat protein